MNLSHTIIPKADQQNADDFISGPRTIRITEVRAGTTEQPVNIYFEGDGGRPYRPGKSMRRVLVEIWGADSAAYIGRRLTLFRDPDVKFGGDDVGGIRISHASDIAREVRMALTVTRGKRKPYSVEPLPAEQPVDLQSLTDTGGSKAKEGTAALRAWFTSLAPAARAAVKPTLDEWKRIAEESDKQGGAAA